MCNRAITVTSETPGVTVTYVDLQGKTYNYVITVPEGTSTLQLTFATKSNQNARIDNIQLLKPAVGKIAPGLAFSKPTAHADQSLSGGGDLLV